jgi:hypothetical protein
MKRIVTLVSALGLVAVLAAGWLFVWSSPTEASADYTGFHAFIDKDQDTYFSFTLDSMTKPTGSAAFGVQGVGIVDLASPTYIVHNVHSMSIRYEGQAALETDAKLDLDFGLNQPGSTVQTVTARVIGQVDLDHGTATVEFWLNGTHYSLVGGRPNKSPDRALTNLTSAISKRDWAAVYGMTAPLWAKLTTRDAWISQMTAYWSSHYGTATPEVTLTSAPVLVDSGLGYWTASVKFSIKAGSVIDAMNVTMQYVGDSWLVLDIRPA